MVKFLILIISIGIFNAEAQATNIFNCLPHFSYNDTLVTGNGEYYYQFLQSVGIKVKCYGQFYIDNNGEKKPYGKHLRFYSGNSLLDENKNKIENTDTTRVSNIFYCDSFGNLQWNILLSYNSREIQTLYLPPISELIINDYNSCFSLLLADTIGFQNKDGEYYYVYEHNPFSKRYSDSTLVYGKFKINNKEKVPYGTHFRFYRNVNTDEFRHAITLDSLRIAGMDYYDNVGKLYKSISIYYTSRKVQSVSLY